jgi:multiple sugar transport system ATP-binding protein
VQAKAADETIRAEVYVVEPLGSENVIDMKIGAFLVNALSSSSLVLDIGQEVHVSFKKEKIHSFDKKTGKTLL